MTGFAVDLRRVAPIRGSCHFGLRRSVWTLWAAGGLVDAVLDHFDVRAKPDLTLPSS
jgi:hypothetical protein